MPSPVIPVFEASLVYVLQGSGNGQIEPVPNFGAVTFSNFLVNGKPVSAYPHEGIAMTAQGQTWATTGPLTSGGSAFSETATPPPPSPPTYPWSSAVCEFGAAGGPTCANPANPKHDLYDWGYFVGATFHPYDQWGYEYRNCTSYVAFRLSQANVSARFSDLGNANQWVNSVRGESGVVVNHVPSPGAVAEWNGPGVGHVAYVDSVAGGQVHISEFNFDTHGDYDSVVIGSPGHLAPNWYIHFP